MRQVARRSRWLGTRSLTLVAMALGSIGLAGSVAAQAVPNRDDAVEVRKQYVLDLDTLQSKFLALAEAIPAEKYSWRPAAGVRSVGEVFMHVASEYYVYTPMAFGATASPAVGRDQAAMTAFEKTGTKETAIKNLKEGFAYATTAVNGVDPSTLVGPKKLFGGTYTIIETSLGMAADMHEHLGQLIAYARMNGIKPPWSK
jgi:uncharacterized damage-inducible protein DinB